MRRIVWITILSAFLAASLPLAAQDGGGGGYYGGGSGSGSGGGSDNGGSGGGSGPGGHSDSGGSVSNNGSDSGKSSGSGGTESGSGSGGGPASGVGSGSQGHGTDDIGIKFYGTVQVKPAAADGNWQISGKQVMVSASTLVTAAVAVGSCVEVQARQQADGTLAATKIGLEDAGRCGASTQDDTPHFIGNIASVPATGLVGNWVVSGRTVQVAQTTEINQNRGPVAIGACAEIEGSVNADNSINAREVKILSGAAGCSTAAENLRLQVEFRGLVQSAPASGAGPGDWQIAGRTVHVTNATRFDGTLPVAGSCVEAKGSTESDGTVTATRIKSEDHGCGTAAQLSFAGTVQSLPASGLTGDWVVSSRTIEVTAMTILEVAASLSTGSCVEVQGSMNADGTVNAVKVESVEGADCRAIPQGEFEVQGTITAGPASGVTGDWSIAGRTVRVSPSTIIDTEHGGLVNGACAEAAGTLQASGILLATRVEVRSASGMCLFRDGVLNGASFTSGTVAPGQIVSLFGSNLGTSSDHAMEIADDRLTRRLDNVRVLFDGIEAPLIFVSANQVNAMVPFEVKGRGETEVQIENNGAWSNQVRMKVSSSAPAIFTATQAGKGQGAVLNFEAERQEYSVNGEDNAARRGSVIVIYATGHGELESGNDDGAIARTAIRTALPVKVRVGEREAEIEYAGTAPGLVNGVLQVNARVPDDAPAGGKVPLVIRVGEQESQDGVTIAVK